MPKFMIQHREFDISVADFEEKMKLVADKKRFPKMHSVEINGKLFSLKQPIAAVTGLPPADITNIEAYLILEKLGYPINFHP